MFEDFKNFVGNLFNRNENSDNYFDLSEAEMEHFGETGLDIDNPSIASHINTAHKR